MHTWSVFLATCLRLEKEETNELSLSIVRSISGEQQNWRSNERFRTSPDRPIVHRVAGGCSRPKMCLRDWCVFGIMAFGQSLPGKDQRDLLWSSTLKKQQKEMNAMFSINEHPPFIAMMNLTGKTGNCSIEEGSTGREET